MREQVIYMRVPLDGTYSSDPAMLGDLALVADLTAEEVDRLVQVLDVETRFLDPALMKSRVDSVIARRDVGKATVQALSNIEPDNVRSVLSHVDQLRAKTVPQRIDDAKMGRLREILPAIVKSYPSLVRYESARKLIRATGRRLETATLTCDIRPIFDHNASSVNGLLPFTRLRLVGKGSDGLPDDFEVELTVEQVHELADAAVHAKKMLATLQTSAEAWLPGGVPNLPETRAPKEK